ncbi:MAG: AcvB/VirJ family lysyl-phosphatidylglycerol hydrolase [Acidobacteriota bacterium]
MMRMTFGLLLLASSFVASAGTQMSNNESLTFGAFGKVALYRPASAIEDVVLFVSGDGGWNQGVVDMAKQLVLMNALVLGIDMPRFETALKAEKGACAYPAAEFEALSQYVQKKLDLPDYKTPILAGYSSGATLVYALLAQAPGGTFAGGLSLGFCPDLEVTKPLCKGSGLTFVPLPKKNGFVFDANPALPAPFHVLQGDIDQVCQPEATRTYLSKIPAAKLYWLPKVGHGYSVPKNWLPQFRDAYRDLRTVSAPDRTQAHTSLGTTGASTPSVDDLPLVEVPAVGEVQDSVAVILTGDGGWAGLDKQVAGALAARGIRCIGWNSLRYYWTARTPDSAAADLARIVLLIQAQSPGAKVLLIGYSLGADVLPFLISRLSETQRMMIASATFIAPSLSVAFEFHLSNWTGGSQADAKPTLPEMQKLAGMKLLCLYGTDDEDSLCPKLPAELASVQKMPGGHHFGGDYEAVASRIIAATQP